MRILVEKGIPFGKEVFESLGRADLYEGRESGNIYAPDTEILVTRSNVRVDWNLLKRLPNLMAILSPTIGLDHVDRSAITRFQDLHSRPLPVINAPGSTAGGVGDYVLAAVLFIRDVLHTLPKNCSVGIWGYGNCGKAAAMRLRATGCRVVAYDPPLQERGGFKSASLDDLLATDCLSIHLPLTTKAESKWPTQGIVDSRVLDAIKGKVLINASRGAVIDEDAMIRNIRAGMVKSVLDVYMNEPMINPDLVGYSVISTPHIAGSIRQGKLSALEHVYVALCNSLKIKGNFNFRLSKEKIRSPFHVTSIPLTLAGRNMVMKAVDLPVLSRKMKDIFKDEDADREFEFVKLRKQSMRDEITWP